MSKHPVGTLVREDHNRDEMHPGCSVWCRVAEWRPRAGGGDIERGWLCLQSDAPGNVLFRITDAEVARDPEWDFDAMPVVGVVPTSEADRQRVLRAEVCTCGCGFLQHNLFVPPHCSTCSTCTGYEASGAPPTAGYQDEHRG